MENEMEEMSSVGVQRPPPQSSARKFAKASKETFFPDDPFRQFKNQSKHRQFILGMQYIFPILQWGPSYKLSDFKSDLVSGLTIASLAIPQGIAYARLANLPPLLGLYSSFLPPLLYAIFGSSRDIAVGPAAVLSIILATMTQNDLGPDASDPMARLRLAFTATFFAGIFQASLGLLRLGFVIDFLSHATIIGFVSGVSIIICLQQFKGILGITHFTKNSDAVSALHSIFEHRNEWNWRTVIMGAVFLIFLLGTKYMGKRSKRFFWIAALAPLLGVIVSTLSVFLTHADKHGIKIVGELKKGLNPPSARRIYLHQPYVTTGMKIGLVLGLVGLMEAIAVGRTFAALKNYHIDGNKEMIAFGTLNIIGSCMSCYITTGAMSRTAVNTSAGCKTPVSNIVMSTIVMITLLALTPLFHYTPNVILSCIIFTALITLVDPYGAYMIWKVDKFDFIACMCAFLGVVFFSIQVGLMAAVGISVLKILLHTSRPHTAVLGRIPGTTIYRNVKHYPKAVTIPGLLVIRIDASIYFSTANYIRERIMRWIDEEEDRLKGNLKFLILDLTPAMTIDTSGIHGLVDIYNNLHLRGIQLALANPGGDVIEKLHKSKSIEVLGQEWIFLTVSNAVEFCTACLQKVYAEEANENLKNQTCTISVLP